MKPFVKWAGGKRQLSESILEIISYFSSIDDNNYTYYEPFIGGGAIFFALSHNRAVINDMNSELINCFRVIRDHPQELMDNLDCHKESYRFRGQDYYYEVRDLDRNDSIFLGLSDIERAGRTIFLNKTCYNGLYRVNSKGQFNTPAGKYANPSLYDKNNIHRISEYLRVNDVGIMNSDYSEAITGAAQGDIVYVDPPYDYPDIGFTQYQKEGFSFDDFRTMKEELDRCIGRGAFVIISNNATERVIRLFTEDPKYQILYDIKEFYTHRNINSKGDKRRTGHEVIIIGIPITFPQANSVEKILRLIRIKNPNDYRDATSIKNILDVKSDRQAQYYLMALYYLGIINYRKELTATGHRFRTLTLKHLRVELAAHIRNAPIFNEIYTEEKRRGIPLTIEEMSHLIRQNNRELSPSTYNRRASTALKWLRWCSSILEE